MTTREADYLRNPLSSEIQSQLHFMVAVIDDCAKSELVLSELIDQGFQPQNLQMFYTHRLEVHSEPLGFPIGRLQVMFQYLEDLLGLDDSTSKEYEEHLKSGQHVLLANIYGTDDSTLVTSVLDLNQSHTQRVLGYGYAARPSSPIL